MKIEKTASGSKKVTMSKAEWLHIGKIAGWDEDGEDGFQNESQRCLEEAERNVPMSDVIPNDGRYHVVSKNSHYCKATDSFAGFYLSLEKSFDDYEEAFLYLQNLLKSQGGDSDHVFDIIGPNYFSHK